MNIFFIKSDDNYYINIINISVACNLQFLLLVLFCYKTEKKIGQQIKAISIDLVSLKCGHIENLINLTYLSLTYYIIFYNFYCICITSLNK